MHIRMTKLASNLFLASLLAASTVNTDYRASVEHWRADQEGALKADDGWLTVAGLFWLKEGINTCECAPRIGTFDFQAGKTKFHASPGAKVMVNGKPAFSTELKSDTDGNPDVVTAGTLTIFVIHRGARYGLRVKDKNSRFRKEFTGLRWFPVREEYRVIAKFVPNQTPRTIPIPNILGETDLEPSPGYATFTLGGKECRLDPVLEGNQYFFVFRDLTAGKETYASGRFLDADPPKDGKIVLDFNKAYNPPCAFTPFATCPLPPRQNRLAVRIEAGELNYPHHW
jgi:uncharacterized protein (DUF1684 family)